MAYNELKIFRGRTFGLPDALISLTDQMESRPVWAWPGDNYADIEWHEENTESCPTLEELQTELARLQAEYDATVYQKRRALEYPDAADFLDAWVKDDTAALEAYRQACLDVKAKYPKPAGE